MEGLLCTLQGLNFRVLSSPAMRALRFHLSPQQKAFRELSGRVHQLREPDNSRAEQERHAAENRNMLPLTVTLLILPSVATNGLKERMSGGYPLKVVFVGNGTVCRASGIPVGK